MATHTIKLVTNGSAMLKSTSLLDTNYFTPRDVSFQESTIPDMFNLVYSFAGIWYTLPISVSQDTVIFKDANDNTTATYGSGGTTKTSAELSMLVNPVFPKANSVIGTGYKETAKRISQAAALTGGNGPTVMASPPTITVGVAQAATTISGSVLTNADNSVFTTLGTVAQVWNVGFTPSPNLLYAANVTAGADGRSSGSKQGGLLKILFCTDAPIFEFGMLVSLTPGNGYRIWINGQPTAIAPRTDSAADGYKYIKVDMTTSVPRIIMLEFEKYASFGGVRVGANYSIWKFSPSNLVKLMIDGDSYTDGTNGNGSSSNLYLQSYAPQVGQRLGLLNTWVNGEGGIGYLKVGSQSAKYARQKAASDVIAYAPDWLVIALGINDFDLVAATVQAEATLYFSTILASLPNTGVTVIGPWKAPSLNPPQAIADAIKAAAQTQPEYNTRLQYFDTYTEVWQSGTGKVGATSGSGNSNIYIGSDGVHPVQVGHDYLGERVYTAVMRHVNSLL